MGRASKRRLENLMSDSLTEKVNDLGEKSRSTDSYSPVKDEKVAFFEAAEDTAQREWREKKKKEYNSKAIPLAVITAVVIVLLALYLLTKG
jgi:hypothetical protein